MSLVVSLSAGGMVFAGASDPPNFVPEMTFSYVDPASGVGVECRATAFSCACVWPEMPPLREVLPPTTKAKETPALTSLRKRKSPSEERFMICGLAPKFPALNADHLKPQLKAGWVK